MANFSNLQEATQKPKQSRIEKQIDGFQEEDQTLPKLKKKENKNRRFGGLMKPSVYERLEVEAQRQHFSVNGFISKLVEDYLDGMLVYKDTDKEN